MKVVQQYPAPTTRKELQRFLGLASFYRKFVHNFAQLTTPLRHLLRKDAPWMWSNEQETAFEALKEKLSTSPTLITYDPDLPLEIRTDASGQGLGAILLQKDRQDRMLGVICYASRFLSTAEQNYSTTEKECLAVVWAVTDKFRPYVEGRSFVVLTDHAALAGQFRIRNPSHRLLRFVTRLQGFNFTIRYQKGTSNADADALSRIPVNVPTLHRQVFAVSDLAVTQDRIPKFSKLKSILRKQNTTAAERRQVRNFILENNLLYYVTKDCPSRLVIPPEERSKILEECHDSLDGGHFDVKRTYHALKQRFYWPKMYQDSSKFVRSCNICQQNNPSTQKRSGPLQPMMAEFPLQCIGIDFEGPFSVMSEKYRYIMTAIDYQSRFALAAPVRAANSMTACRFLHDIIIRQHGPHKF